VATSDYEAEYNNRARVPKHPEIFARWTREAELFRAEMLKDGRAELGLSYGDTPRQYLDLFLPRTGEAAPLAPAEVAGLYDYYVKRFARLAADLLPESWAPMIALDEK